MAADFTPDALITRAKREEDTYGQKELPAMLRAGAEAMRERNFWMTDGQRLLHRDEARTVCETVDLCFEHGQHAVARCGPCAAKLAARAGVEVQRYTASNPEAMRLRRELAAAEAKLAALQEKPHD